MALINPAYCSEDDIKRFFSTFGADSFADHDDDGFDDSEVFNDCINQATEEINGYCLQKYDTTGLNSSTLINRWCTVMATYFLCTRRGNPPSMSLQSEFERIIGMLERVLAGTFNLPAVAFAHGSAPAMSNLRVDRRFRKRTIRVQQESSTKVNSQLPRNYDYDHPIDGS